MPILRVLVETREPVEVQIDEISEELNNVLSNNHAHYTPPRHIPYVEHRGNLTDGHIRAGSEVIVPDRDVSSYVNSQEDNLQNFVTYTFRVEWDYRNRHWNLRIFKTFHFNGRSNEHRYKLPEVEGLDHITHTDEIRIELLNDDQDIIFSKLFRKR